MDHEVTENSIHLQELSLRSRVVSSTRELEPLNDKYDSIDLTDNALTSLDDFPTVEGPLTRLKTLILANNAITSIAIDISGKFPNLYAISLANNQIGELDSLQFIKDLPKLKHLVVLGNPIAKGDYRDRLRRLQPNLKYIDFEVAKCPHQMKFKRHDEKEVANLLKRLDEATSTEEIQEIEEKLVMMAEK